MRGWSSWVLTLSFLSASLIGGVWIGIDLGDRVEVVQGHEMNGSHWDANPVGYRDITNNYSGNVISRRNDFNSAVDNVSLEAQSSDAEVQIGDANYGLSGWAGICRKNTPRWTRWYYIDLNERYMEGYGGNKRSAVVAHEMGHCIGGLTHHEETGVVMQSSLADFYDNDDVWYIDSVTASEIDALWED